MMLVGKYGYLDCFSLTRNMEKVDRKETFWEKLMDGWCRLRKDRG